MPVPTRAELVSASDAPQREWTGYAADRETSGTTRHWGPGIIPLGCGKLLLPGVGAPGDQAACLAREPRLPAGG